MEVISRTAVLWRGKKLLFDGIRARDLIKEPETEQMDQTNAIHGKEAGKRKCANDEEEKENKGVKEASRK